MTDLSLRPEIVTPPHSDLLRMLAVGVGCGLIGAALTLAANPPPATPALAPPVVEIASVESVHVSSDPEVAAESPAPAPTPGTSQLLFVFRAAGDTYVRLADVGEGHDAMPPHGKLALFEKEETTAIAAVRDADVPAAHRGWKGKRVVVDGSCKATVTGFAVVSRLVGDTGYAEIEGATSWTADSVMSQGRVVLAARIDGCAKGLYARDAALAPIIVPTPIQNAELANAARSALLASDAASDAAREWADHKGEGAWYDTGFTTQIVRHPKTGVTWIAIHGHPDSDGCGGPDVNVFGLYRVESNGTLVAVEERKLEDIHSIVELVDVDGDGEFELIGRPWLGLDVVLAHTDGSEIDRLTVPFFGCPC